MVAEPLAEKKIGLLNERPLHAALKQWIAQPGDRFEVPVGRYVVDVVRDDLLIEIQTANFSAARTKLSNLLKDHPVRLVYPIARDKWIVKNGNGKSGQPRRRKSPRHGAVEDLFRELVSFPALMRSPNLSLEVLLIREEEVRRRDGKRHWRRRGWVTEERRLIDVVERRRFDSPFDLSQLLPTNLPSPFTTRDLAEALDRPRWLAQKMAYCLRAMDVIVADGKEGNAILYVPAWAGRPAAIG